MLSVTLANYLAGLDPCRIRQGRGGVEAESDPGIVDSRYQLQRKARCLVLLLTQVVDGLPVMVADGGPFAVDRLPRSVDLAAIDAADGEALN